MFRAIAVLALVSASASANSPTTLNSSAPWWERVSILVASDGKAQSCQYESSLQPNGAKSCSVVDGPAAMASAASAKNQLTRITFERRFRPGGKPEAEALQPGETLLGGRVMALAIDAKGAVKTCEIVASSGEVTPQYGCDDLAAERFEASVSDSKAEPNARQGYMSIIVYGHSEHVV